VGSKKKKWPFDWEDKCSGYLKKCKNRPVKGSVFCRTCLNKVESLNKNIFKERGMKK